MKAVFGTINDAQTENIKQAMNETQKKIANIWKEILGLDEISIDANFYESGGNSLFAMSLASKLSLVFNRKIKVSDILKNLSIAEQEIMIMNAIENNDVLKVE